MAEAPENFTAGLKFLKDDNLDRALKAFDKAYKEDKENASYMSYFGLCKALRGGEIGLGLELCTRAIKKEFRRAEFYVNLGRVYMAAGNKKGAIKVFQKGLRYDPDNEQMNRYLIELGFRGRPIVPVFKRNNPVNKYLGILVRRTLPSVMKKKRKP